MGNSVVLLWDNIQVTTPCIEWTGSRHPRGYGRIRTKVNRDRLAHVVALEKHLGRPLLPGMQANHACDTPLCVSTEPGHVYEGTPRDNSRDMVEHGRSAIAIGHHPQANQTECVNGHDFTPENTGMRRTGGRYCKQCKRERSREWMRLHRGGGTNRE